MFPFGKQNKVNNAFKCQYSNAFKIKYYKCLPKMALRANYLGCLGTLYGIFMFIYKMFLFAITAYFLPFPDKNLWFSSQRRREGVVGDANGSISK